MNEFDDSGVYAVFHPDGMGNRISAMSDLVGARKTAAKVAGVSVATLQRYIAGDTQASFQAMAAMALSTGVSLHWLATGSGPMMVAGDGGGEAMRGAGGRGEAPIDRARFAGSVETTGRARDMGNAAVALHRVPFLRHWRAMLDWVTVGGLPEAVSYIDTAARTGSRAYALPVRSKIMQPMFPVGVRIIVDPDLPRESETFVVMQIEGFAESTFRKLVMEAGSQYLEPLDPAYKVIDLGGKAHTYCGRVVYMEMDLP